MTRKIFIYISTFFLFCITTISNAQIDCGSDLIHQSLLKTDSSYKIQSLKLEAQIKSIIQSKQKANGKVNAKNAVYKIPIVIHVIHIGEAIGVGSNISDAQILGAINGLNSRWRNSNGIGVDLEFEFCLATRDPNGNPTSGINRVNGSGVPRYTALGISGGCCAQGAKEDSVKMLSRWPVSDYYNIWVVKAMCGNCAGYAYPPTGTQVDGVVILCTSMTNGFTALTHEVGHGFAAYHTFQGDGNGASCPVNNSCLDDGDKVCDTPPHKQGDCGPTNPCSATGIWDNSLHNYMSYCGFPDRFTQGQKDRMRAAASVPPRLSLLTSLGCGSVCPVPDQPLAIIGNTTLCSGSSNIYSVAAVSGASEYNWTLPSGWSGGSTSNTILATAGSSSGNITVKATNNCGSSIAQILNVTVNTIPSQPTEIHGKAIICSGSSNTYSLDVVSGATAYVWTLPIGWSGTSTINNITTTSSATGGNITVRAINSCGSSIAQTLIVTVNTIPSQPTEIHGNASICSGSSNTYSLDAVIGATAYVWTLPTGWSGNSITNNITTTSSATGGNISVKATNSCGSSADQTLSVTVNAIPAMPTITQAGFTLISSSGFGNQWYLNGTLINGATGKTLTAITNGTYNVVVTIEGCSSEISAPVVIVELGIEERIDPYLFSIYPNPNEGTFHITFNSSITSNYKLELHNSLGQLIFKEELINFIGAYSKKLKVTEYGVGVYTISLTNSNNETIKKIVVY